MVCCCYTCRRIYQGLLKLLDANSTKKEQSTSTTKKSGQTREISRLVTHIALGNEIKIHGKNWIISPAYTSL